MAWKLSNLPGGKDFPVEQATAAPGEKRDMRGWRFAGDGPSAGPCANCGSLNTYKQMLDVSVDAEPRQIPGVNVCRDCAGPDGE